MQAQHIAHMARAIQLAKRGLYSTSPNPRVGCVLTRNGDIIAEGWHQKAGEAHAEVAALNDAAKRGVAVKGATAYVSLEPCSHQGKTGPCSQALIAAQIACVVYGAEDPNPKVAGRGLAQLRAAGIEVIGPVLESEARALNPGFNKRMEQGLPLVRLKLAMSLDGRTAMANGESQWITGPAARADVQHLRAQSCAIVSGIGTVLQDNARLTVRGQQLNPPQDPAAMRQPLRVVVDSNARLTKEAALLQAPSPVWWVTREPATALSPQVSNIVLPDVTARIDLRKLLQQLAANECNEVLVEAGATLAGRFVELGLVDELIIYMAPTLMGSSARPLLDLAIANLGSVLTLSIADVRAVGNDWRITARLNLDD